jgi:hypothetical protein
MRDISGNWLVLVENTVDPMARSVPLLPHPPPAVG